MVKPKAARPRSPTPRRNRKLRMISSSGFPSVNGQPRKVDDRTHSNRHTRASFVPHLHGPMDHRVTTCPLAGDVGTVRAADRESAQSEVADTCQTNEERPSSTAPERPRAAARASLRRAGASAAAARGRARRGPEAPASTARGWAPRSADDGERKGAQTEAGCSRTVPPADHIQSHQVRGRERPRYTRVEISILDIAERSRRGPVAAVAAADVVEVTHVRLAAVDRKVGSGRIREVPRPAEAGAAEQVERRRPARSVPAEA